MIKDVPHQNDEFLVQHLVDPTNWVSDNERTLCNVCTRQFSTFRRKHHCRMCGEIVCSNCTLLKSALLATIGYTRVRVCVSCVFNHAHSQKVHVPASHNYFNHINNNDSISFTPTDATTTEESRQWLSSHLHSPLFKSDEEDHDTGEYGSGNSFANNNTNNYGDNGNNVYQYEYEYEYQQQQRRHRGPTSNNNQTPSPQKPQSSPSYRSNNQRDTAASPSSSSSSPSWSHPWPKPPVAADEASRLHALHALDVLDSDPEKPYDMICDLAKARLSSPMAAVSFMDKHRQWFKASVGLAHKMIPRKIAFCAYTVFTKEPIVVLDTLKDKRFDCNPLVSGAAAVRFYAAAPIIDPSSGHAIGSVFVLDTRPRESCDVAILERLAHAASENLPQREESPEQQFESCYAPVSPLSPAPSTSSLSSVPSSSSSAAVSPMNNNCTGKSSAVRSPTSPASPNNNSALSTMLSTATRTSSNGNGNGGAVASGKQMEMLLMRLLTQNMETQQQLATQQISISNTIGFHSTQINKLMTDFAHMEAKIEAKIK